jgi:hypothetical protein
MASDKPKAIIQLSAVDPAVKRAFMKEATDYKSPSELFEKMWQVYVANQTANA